MDLSNLKRIDKIAKYIMREEMNQYLHIDTDMKSIKVKIQKYYKEIDNYTEFQHQPELKRAITLFLTRYQENKAHCFFDMDVRIYAQRPLVNNFKKITYPEDKAGYQYRHQHKRKKHFSDATSFLSQPSSFQDSDFAKLNQDGDEKFKDVDCIKTNDSISVNQTSLDSEDLFFQFDKAWLDETDSSDISSLVVKSHDLPVILQKLEFES